MFDPCAPLLPDVIALHGRWRSDWPAIVSPEGTLGWAAFDQRANRIANRLVATGMHRGDRVALVMSNGLAMLEIMVGIMKAGYVVVPLNPASADTALQAMLEDAGAAMVFATEDHAHRLALSTGVSRIIAPTQPAAALDGWQCCRAWLGDTADTAPMAAVGPDDICNIIYSSGTTGQPKGIVHTHQARLDWAHDLTLALRYHSGARTLVVTGLYSNISWGVVLATLLVGGTIVLRHAFQPADTLATIERERITHLGMVPVQFQRLLEQPEFERTDRTSMQAMMSCGSPLPAAVKARIFATFSCGVTELYGATEGVITTLPPEELEGRLASVGRPLPGSDILILGPDDRPVGPGEAGEVLGRNRFVMAGYWRKPEATAAVMWADNDGHYWLRTGDIGRVDEQGYLYIVDRKKDLIVSGGQNIYPADLESVLIQHPDVRECAVIGVPSDVWGESPLALVTLRHGADIDPDELRQWLNQRVGKQQRVVGVEIRSELPRNATGKLLKRELRAPFWVKS